MRTRITAFFWGVTIASAIAVLLLVIFQPAGDEREVKRWQARAEDAERQLALVRNQVQTVSAQLAAATARRESVSQRPAVTSVARESTLPTTSPPLPSSSSSNSVLFDSTRQTEWRALVAGTLQSEVQRRLGRTLPPEQEQRLLDTLARLRDASLGLSQEPNDPEDPAALSDQLMRSIVLLEADRVFRDELGIGVSGFLQGLSADQIEEVAPVEPASARSP